MLTKMQQEHGIPHLIMTNRFEKESPEIEHVHEMLIEFAEKQNGGTIEDILGGFIIKTENYTICAFDRTVCINYYSERNKFYSADIDMESGLVTNNIKKAPEDFLELFKNILIFLGGDGNI